MTNETVLQRAGAGRELMSDEDYKAVTIAVPWPSYEDGAAGERLRDGQSRGQKRKEKAENQIC